MDMQGEEDACSHWAMEKQKEGRAGQGREVGMIRCVCRPTRADARGAHASSSWPPGRAERDPDHSRTTLYRARASYSSSREVLLLWWMPDCLGMGRGQYNIMECLPDTTQRCKRDMSPLFRGRAMPTHETKRNETKATPPPLAPRSIHRCFFLSTTTGVLPYQLHAGIIMPKA